MTPENTGYYGILADTDEMGREVKEQMDAEVMASMLPKGNKTDNTKARLLALAQEDTTRV